MAKQAFPVTDSNSTEQVSEEIRRRRETLREVRGYTKSLSRTFWICIVVCLAFSLPDGVTEGKWTGGLPWLLPAVIPGFAYLVCRQRVATLSALEKGPNQPPADNA